MQNDMRDKFVDIIKQKSCHHSDTPCDTQCVVCGCVDLYSRDIENIADHLIANDVVPVVRCKDCKHYSDFDAEKCKRLNFHFCKKFSNITKENDYCSYGERSADNGKI